MYFQVEGTFGVPEGSAWADRLVVALATVAENEGALFVGGVVQIDADGIPTAITGWRRLIYQIGERLVDWAWGVVR